MAVHRRHVEVTRPCPIRLDPNRGKRGEKTWYCGHCNKDVHVLSNLTEREARDLLAEKVGQDLCVTYAVRSDGSIRFRPEPPAPVIPASALTRKRAAAATAAVGLSAALAACTPHENDAVEKPNITVERREAAPTPPPTIPAGDAKQLTLEPELTVDGGIEAVEVPEPPPKPGGLKVQPPPPEPEDVAIPGGVTVEAIPEPTPERETVRGGIGAKPVDLDEPCDTTKDPGA